MLYEVIMHIDNLFVQNFLCVFREYETYKTSWNQVSQGIITERHKYNGNSKAHVIYTP